MKPTATKGPCAISRVIERAIEVIDPGAVSVSGGVTVHPSRQSVRAGGNVKVGGLRVGKGGIVYDHKNRRITTYRN